MRIQKERTKEMMAKQRFVAYLKDKCKHLEITQDADEFWKLLKEEDGAGPANDFYEAVGNATTDYYYDHVNAGKLFVELGIFSSTHAVDKSGNEKDAIKLKNVAGEIFGAITIMKAARKLKLKRIKLYFDFNGIEDIALGKAKPKQKNRFLLSYRDFFMEVNKYIKIDFCKVKSHSGVNYHT